MGVMKGPAMTWRIALVLLGLGAAWAALGPTGRFASARDSAAVQCPPGNPTPGTISAFG